MSAEYAGDEAVSRTPELKAEHKSGDLVKVHAGLMAAFLRLDQRLQKALSEVPASEDVDPDPYRGLYISAEQVARLLRREPGVPCFGAAAEQRAEKAAKAARLSSLQSAFGLSDFDIDVVLVALAPEFDLRYERLYAYLQDDVTRRRPTVSLALDLLCCSPPARFDSLSRFFPDAPLLRHELIHLVDDSGAQAPLLARNLKLDNSVVRYLFGRDGLDPRLAAFSRMSNPRGKQAVSSLPERTQRALAALVAEASESGEPLTLCFDGPAGVGKTAVAEALAARLEAPLLRVDLSLCASRHGAERPLTSVVPIVRQARLHGAVVLFEGVDALERQEAKPGFGLPLEKVPREVRLTIVSGERVMEQHALKTVCGLENALQVPFPAADFEVRRECWRSSLAGAGSPLKDGEVESLASRLLLSPRAIREAVAGALNDAKLLNGASRDGVAVGFNDLLAAARGRSNRDLGSLARVIEPKYGWDEIVLPPDARQQLKELCDQAKYRHVVYGQWGFDRKLSLGKGLNVLFSGPPGTGKTMACEVIARELGLNLFKIDLSQIVSKYIGETEKNLNKIFDGACMSNAILLFDEADALFGKRSEVRDSHDRYANIEIAYLLQKMEEYEGISILATNLKENLDKAFLRRLSFNVDFPFPDEASRLRIWQSIWPLETPLADELDLAAMARFTLSGGSIKNIAVAGAFFAAEENVKVATPHLLKAAKREFQKMGKTLSPAELNGFRAQGRLIAEVTA